VLRQIIHDWDDADAVRILERCRAAMAPTGRVLINDAGHYTIYEGIPI
jgi:hypothetical protein